MAIDLAELERRISATVPHGYVQYVQSNTADSLAQQGFDPTTLLVLNLQVQTRERTPEHSHWFYLAGDGCGNYYFVDPKVAPDKVFFWCHDDGIGIHDTGLKLASFLPTAIQQCRCDLPPRPEQLYICRTLRWGESILNPIELDEWIQAVQATNGMEYVGYRVAPNPFTGETIRIDLPGLAIFTSDDEMLKSKFDGGFRSGEAPLCYGCVYMRDTPNHRIIAQELASKLHAQVLTR